MRFQTDKDSRKKTMDKLLKQVKTEMKNVPYVPYDETVFDKLKNSCLKASETLYEYMLKSIDTSEDDGDSKEIN